MNRITFAQIILAITLMIVGIPLLASSTNNKTSTPATTTSSVYTEDKQNIVVSKNHPEFVIKLKSNPTTGYSWFLHEYDINLIMPVKHNFQAAEQKLIGAPGFEFWTFRIKPAGFVVPQQSIIRMIYSRPWQDNGDSTEHVFRVSTVSS